jgi:CRP/FNR family cyclic AMP-dependent transcriptional regulator
MKMIELFEDWEDQVEVPKGAVIFKEGDLADVMYVVTEGEVEVTLKGEPLGAELPGGLLGEMAMIKAKYRSATATAIRNTRLARNDQEQFKEMVSKNPDFALHVMEVLANRLRVANMLLTS